MEAVQVYDSGVDVPQVDDFGLLVPVLVKHGIGTDEEENTDPHDERTKDLQPIGVQIPAETFNTANQRNKWTNMTNMPQRNKYNHLNPEPL